MDRKAFLNTLLAPPLKKKPAAPLPVKEVKTIPQETPMLLQSGLNPYVGSWTTNEVIHLLKRLQFGAPKEEVDYFSTLTYPQAVDLLLNTVNTNIGAPIKTYTTDVTAAANDPDWTVPMGKTWVNAPSTTGSVNSNRQNSVKYWWWDLMINQPRSIEEKMILFWSTHFAIEFDTVTYGMMLYNHLNLLRTHCMGNFKAFTKAISISPAMLIYLNGRYNTKSAPDENYGRELQELFTMGKGPGSQYTEDDVKAAAKVLTGYNVNVTTSTYGFTLSNHDTTNKTFSPFYNNTVITGGTTAATAQAELDDMLTMIFAKEESSKYICRRLYRFFVYGNITADIETNIIEPLATIFRNANYEIKPVLAALFKSEHFFDVLTQGAMIKAPLDLMIGQIREFKMRFPPKSNMVEYNKMIAYLHSTATTIDQNVGDPPNVSGWGAYYQDPLYDRVWLNTDTYTKRLTLFTSMVNGYTNTNQTIKLDAVNFASRMTAPGDPNQLVQDFCTYLLRMPLALTTRNTIKTATLLTGQITDSYWTDAWTQYVADPGSPSKYSNVNTRLTALVKYFINLEEYQLM